MPIRIEKIRTNCTDQSSDLLATIRSSDGEDQIVFHRHSSVDGLDAFPPRPDAFVVLLLMHAMKTRQDIWVDSPMDPNLLFHLRREIQVVLKLCFPELELVKIEAPTRTLSDAVVPKEYVATGFSGGVDSMQLIHRKLHDESLPSDYVVNMLMHHNVGSVAKPEQYLVNYRHTAQFAADFDLAIAGASYEAGRFFDGYSFLETHTLRTVAATLSLSPIYKRYLFASGTDLKVGLRIFPTRVIDAGNPFLLPLLETLECQFLQFGAECTRLEKMLEILGNQKLLPHVNLCARVSHDNSIFLNCARCFKCFPFLLIAEAVGRLEDLGVNFDLSSFYQHKSRCFTNFFIDALGPKKQQTNRQVAWFLRNHSPALHPWGIRALLQVVPDPISESHVDDLLSKIA
jgi:hypothetical protein